MTDKGEIALPEAAEGLRRALAAPPGLAAVLDGADDASAGGSADTPALLRALLAASPRVAALFAYLCDPDVVDSCWRVGVGGHLSCLLGGKRSTAYGAPVEVEGRVVKLTEGEFVDAAAGAVSLGHTAILRSGDTWIVLTERLGPADDPAFYALHGVDLARVRLLCVKGGEGFAGAFGGRCTAVVRVRCPGPLAP